MQAGYVAVGYRRRLDFRH